MISGLKRRAGRLAIGSVAFGGAVTLIMGGGTAMAAPHGDGPPGADVAKAQKVVDRPATRTRLAKFFVHLDRHRAGLLPDGTSAPESAIRAKAPRIVGSVHPVYSLNPDFVRGEETAPIARFAYMAVRARSATGQQASVQLTKGDHGWQITNITTGTEETTYPAKAGSRLVFTEPQLNAWYRLADGRVTGLNATAKTSVGQGVTRAEYQKLVHQRYADKLPGSTYVRDHMLGGYQPTTGTASIDDDGGLPTSGLLALASCVVAGGIATGFAIRRRRANSPR